MEENRTYTLEEVLEKHTVEELKSMTQVLEVKVLSKAKKQEIIDALKAKLLDKETLTAWLFAAGKQEIAELELAMSEKVVIAQESGRFYYWRNLPVVFVTGAGEVIMPTDTAQIYQEIKGDGEYISRRSCIDAMDEYLLACVNLYRAIDIATFLSILNRQTELNVTREELEGWLKEREAVRGQQMYFCEGGYLLSEEYRTRKDGESADYHQLLERQGSMGYYIPAKSELLRYADPYYVEKTPSYTAFCRFVKERLGRPENEAAVIGSHIQLIMRHGAMPKDIFEEMARFGLNEENEELMNDFITVMMDMYNNTRMPETRGYTTLEAQKADPSRQKKIATASEVVTSSIPIVKNRIGGKKIYPNDLCPCGSGKKYKNCCARNRQ